MENSLIVKIFYVNIYLRISKMVCNWWSSALNIVRTKEIKLDCHYNLNQIPCNEWQSLNYKQQQQSNW